LDKGCETGTISLHSWSFLENPLYRDNEDLRNRVLAEYANVPENERKARVRGDWYYETPLAAVFSGLVPEVVEDFDIPDHWNQVRFTDPAAHTTGHAIFAEDPDTGIWYCTHGLEINFGVIAKAEEIITEIEKLKPHPDFRYLFSKYDNAEAWFGAYASDRKYGYTANILKNRERAIMDTRKAIGNGRLKFFRRGGHQALLQLRNYHFNKDGDKIVKKKDHILDCVMYFCREIPPPPKGFVNLKTERQLLLEQHMKEQDKKMNARPANPYSAMRRMTNQVTFRRQVR
jgi:hypothetical protein